MRLVVTEVRSESFGLLTERRHYNGPRAVTCCDAFSSSSVLSWAFSVLCVYSKFGHHPHPLGYLCAKFHFFRGLHSWASPWNTHGPLAWNAVPSTLRDIAECTCFRKLLKTHFFDYLAFYSMPFCNACLNMYVRQAMAPYNKGSCSHSPMVKHPCWWSTPISVSIFTKWNHASKVMDIWQFVEETDT